MIAAIVVAFAVYRLAFAPISVISHRVAMGPIVAEVMGTGTLNPHVKAGASPKAFQGRLSRVLVDQNNSVTNGQILAELDDSEQRRQVEAAEATLGAAEAAFHRLEADEARAQADLKLAQLNFARASGLLQAKIVSREEFDTTEATLERARSGLAVAKLAIAEAEQQRVSAEKQLGYQKELLADTLIRAPFNGLVIKRNHDPGDVVTPGASVLDIADTNEIWVSAWVDETAMAPLRTNQAARVVFRSEPTRAYRGRVVRLGRETDPETREFVVDIALTELPANWTVGQRAEVYIETHRAGNAVVLPVRYLLWQDGQPSVLVNVKGVARRREIKLGAGGRDTVEVTSGLTPGEEAVAPALGETGSSLAGRRIKVGSAAQLSSESLVP